jgi:hypothetical protein
MRLCFEVRLTPARAMNNLSIQQFVVTGRLTQIMPSNQDRSIHLVPVILTPTFNNAATLGDVLRRIAALQLPVIIINDGSTDQTADVLKQFPTVYVLTHQVNQGKAAALRTGFEEAVRRGFTHALTIDTDGQHDPEQIPQLLEEARQSPAALVLGRRERRIAGYPRRNRFGRWFSNTLVWLESGLRVDDSQCGLRVYPLHAICAIDCPASRYGYETEILTQAAWRGIGVVEVPVHCRYSETGEQVSHFRPLADSARALAMHGRLLIEGAARWFGMRRRSLPRPATDPVAPGSARAGATRL